MTRKILGSILFACFLSCGSVTADLITYEQLHPEESPKERAFAKYPKILREPVFTPPAINSLKPETIFYSFLYQVDVVLLLFVCYSLWKYPRLKDKALNSSKVDEVKKSSVEN